MKGSNVSPFRCLPWNMRRPIIMRIHNATLFIRPSIRYQHSLCFLHSNLGAWLIFGPKFFFLMMLWPAALRNCTDLVANGCRGLVLDWHFDEKIRWFIGKGINIYYSPLRYSTQKALRNKWVCTSRSSLTRSRRKTFSQVRSLARQIGWFIFRSAT